MAVFTSRRSGGGMARWLLLAAIAGSFLLGWLTLVGQRVGVYNPEVGAALLAIANVCIFAPCCGGRQERSLVRTRASNGQRRRCGRKSR